MFGLFRRISSFGRENTRLPGSPTGGLTPRRSPQTVKPTVEILEERCTPTTVTNLLDNGAGSLRDEVAATILLGPGGTVDFMAGLTGTITLNTGQILIDDSLTIQGPGAGVLSVSGNNASRIFFISDGMAANVSVNISGLTLTQGSSLGGGALYSQESLTLDSVVISNNTATSTGGAILEVGDGTLTIRNSTISGNNAGNGGGGVYMQSNTAGNPLTGVIQNCTISGNTDTGNRGAGVYTRETNLTIQNSTISGNIETTSGGGGVYFRGEYSGNTYTLVIDRSTIANNQALYGGGLEIFSPGNLILTNSTVSGNQSTGATRGAGGMQLYNVMAAIDNCTFANNTASTANNVFYGGGAIRLYGGTTTIRNSTIAGNSVTTAGGRGGGIHVRDSTAMNATLTLISTIVANNSDSTGPNDLFNGSPGSDTVNASNSLFSTAVTTGAGNTINGTNTANLFSANPLLGPLQNNGGFLTGAPGSQTTIQTMALLTGSPAINTGSNPAGLAFDERGTPFVRTFGAGTDMGAFEAQPFTTTTVLVANNNPSTVGQNVSFTATVSSNGGILNIPNGTVNFFDGAVLLGSATLAANGLATFATAGLTAGTHTITAVYVGNADFLTSNSNAVNQVVNAVPPPPPPPPGGNLLLVAGAGAGGQSQVTVRFTDGSSFSFFAYTNGFSGGITVAVGDVDGDGFADVVTGAGPGGMPEVKVFDGRWLLNRQVNLIGDFFAYALGFSGGVNVAVGRIYDPLGPADIVTAPGAGGLSQINVFQGGAANLQAYGAAVGPAAATLAFFAWDNGFGGGATVAVGDVDGDGFADVVVGAGPGALPEVKVFSGADIAAGVANPTVIADFLAFDQSFSGGVFVSAGDGDDPGGEAVIVVGAGAGGGPQVSAFELDAARQLITLGSFFAFPQTFSGGVRVAQNDTTGDGLVDEVMAGAGPGASPQVNRYLVTALRTGDTTPAESFFAFDQAFTGGVFVAGKPF